MDQANSRPKTLTLKQVLEGAERAHVRVSAWPDWKRELSGTPRSKGEEGRRVSQPSKD